MSDIIESYNRFHKDVPLAKNLQPILVPLSQGLYTFELLTNSRHCRFPIDKEWDRVNRVSTVSFSLPYTKTSNQTFIDVQDIYRKAAEISQGIPTMVLSAGTQLVVADYEVEGIGDSQVAFTLDFYEAAMFPIVTTVGAEDYTAMDLYWRWGRDFDNPANQRTCNISTGHPLGTIYYGSDAFIRRAMKNYYRPQYDKICFGTMIYGTNYKTYYRHPQVNPDQYENPYTNIGGPYPYHYDLNNDCLQPPSVRNFYNFMLQELDKAGIKRNEYNIGGMQQNERIFFEVRKILIPENFSAPFVSVFLFDNNCVENVMPCC